METRRATGEAAQHSIEDVHVEALMSMIHAISSAGATRPTNELDIRQRLVVQSLGLRGPQPIAAIGSRLGLSASTMTGVIDRLVALDMVIRVAHPSDRRIKLVELTSTGHTVFAHERTFYASLLHLTIGALGEESASTVLNALAALSLLDLETPE